MDRQTWLRTLRSPLAHDARRARAIAILLGATLGTAFAVVVASAFASRANPLARPVLDAVHLPPLLTTADEPVELRYDVQCSSGEEEPDVPCDAEGTLFVRASGANEFRPLPLRIDPGAAEGGHAATVPPGLRSGRGFEYYAVFRSARAGLTVTLPAGGSSAPHRSLPLERVVDVRLGRHGFGAVRPADARMVTASWGDGQDKIGLEAGPNVSPTGGSSFDVDSSGTVHVLDEAHRRLLRWTMGSQRPQALPLGIDGTLADLSVSEDGVIYVLESASEGRNPLLRVFDSSGREQVAIQAAERTTSQVRLGRRGPVVLQYPSSQWMPLLVDGVAQTASAQARGGEVGRRVAGGGEVVILRRGNEIRAAVVTENGVRRSWRITSATSVAEIQLAEPFGNGLVLVARLYTDREDEFVVLVLGPSGLLRSYSLASKAWAETAPLARFRLEGSSLYQLGSTPAGLFVDRFDLEVT